MLVASKVLYAEDDRAIAGSVHLEPVGAEEQPVARFITASPARGGEVRVGRRFARDGEQQDLVAIPA